MTKREFLKKLREYLQYELPESYVEKNEAYYSSYIDEEVKLGRSVEDVLNDLGDPQLIARTIIDAAKSGDDGIPNTGDDRDFYAEIYGDGNDGIKGSSVEDGGASSGSGTQTGGNSSSGRGSSYSGGNSDYGTGRQPYRGNFYTFNGGCFTCLICMLVVLFLSSFIMPVLFLFGRLFAPLCMVLLIMWLLSRRR